MQNILLRHRPRKPRPVAKFVLAIALGLVIGGSPAAAALYTDSFSATINSATNVGGGYNPYGLANGMTFLWSMTFNSDTIMPPGVIAFSGYYPTNQVSFAIPKSGSPPQILTEKMDYSYGAGKADGAWGSLSAGAFNPSASRLESLYYGGDNGVCILNLFTDAPFFELFFSSSSSQWSAFTFDPGLVNFNPATDRHVVPIPGALVLLSSGLAALAILRRRQA